ncbi:MAG: serine/threonine-protein kinase [Sandaracinaceae bacterium]
MNTEDRSELETAPGPPAGRSTSQHGLASLDKYEPLRILGRGGHSVVHEARQKELDRLVAVKINTHTDATSAKRMLVEAKLLARIDHPGVVDVYELGQTSTGAPFLVMERLIGKTLKEALDEEGPFSEKAIVGLGDQILSALAAVHDEGLVHRDIKPANVMRLEADRTGLRPLKLIDFGIGYDMEGQGERLTGPADLLGTPAYLAPEQLSPHVPSDERTDLYGVGITLYELLTGRLPFDRTGTRLLEQVLFAAPPAASVARPELRPVLDRFLQRAMAKAPGERFTNARQMRAALLAIPIPLR